MKKEEVMFVLIAEAVNIIYYYPFGPADAERIDDVKYFMPAVV
jgi:hypothetical protein